MFFSQLIKSLYFRTHIQQLVNFSDVVASALWGHLLFHIPLLQFPDNPGQVQVHSHLNFEGDAFRVIWNQSSDLFLISLLFGGGFQASSYLSLACG